MRKILLRSAILPLSIASGCVAVRPSPHAATPVPVEIATIHRELFREVTAYRDQTGVRVIGHIANVPLAHREHLRHVTVLFLDGDGGEVGRHVVAVSHATRRHALAENGDFELQLPTWPDHAVRLVVTAGSP